MRPRHGHNSHERLHVTGELLFKGLSRYKCVGNSCVPAGEESGGFSFTVTDGEHTTPLYQFVVTARPLTITMVTQEELVVFPGSPDILQTRKLRLLY